MPRFFARRNVYLPTAWGWLLILVAASGSILLLGRNLYAFLAVTEPIGARVLVVEGTIPTEGLDEAIALFRAGGYERVIVTGGPTSGYPEFTTVENFAEFAAGYLRVHGLADVPIDAVPAPKSAQDRTFLCAVMLRDWASRSGVTLDAIDLVSSGPHARRSRALFQAALGDGVRVGIVATTPPDLDPNAWWNTSAGAKYTIVEALNWAWVALFFRPPPAGSQEELWTAPRHTPASPGSASAER